MASGWDNGLCQDYDRKLGAWFADRLGAREELREVWSAVDERHDNDLLPMQSGLNMTVELEMLNEDNGRLRREVATWKAHCIALESALGVAREALEENHPNCHTTVAEEKYTAALALIETTLGAKT